MAKRRADRRIGRRLVRESLILSYLSRFSSRLGMLASRSRVCSFFTGASDTEEGFSNSFLGRAGKNIRFSERLGKPVKTAVSRAAESSAAMRFYRMFTNALLATSVRTYGIFFTTFSAYSIALYIAGRFGSIGPDGSAGSLIYSVLMLIPGIVMLFSHGSLVSCLSESKIFIGLFVRVLGFERMVLHSRGEAEKRGGTAFMAGTLFGLATLIIPIQSLLGMLVIFIALAVIMYSPETGLLILIAMIFVAKEKILVFAVAATLISYFFKVLRSKRNISFRPAEIFIFIFMLFTLGTGLSGSAPDIKQSLVWLCFAGIFLLTVSLCVTDKMFAMTLKALCLSMSVRTIAAAVYAVGKADISSDIGESALSFLESFVTSVPVYQTVMMLPVIFLSLKYLNTALYKLSAVFLAIFSAAVIIRSFSFAALVAAIAVIYIYYLFSARKFFNTSVFLLVTAIIMIFLSNTDAAQLFKSGLPGGSYAVDSLNLVGPHLYTGVGNGIQASGAAANLAGVPINTATANLYTALSVSGGIFYTLSFLVIMFYSIRCAFSSMIYCPKNEKRCLPSCFASMLIFFAVSGLFMHIWQSTEVMAVVWLICGVACASYRVSYDERKAISKKETERTG